MIEGPMLQPLKELGYEEHRKLRALAPSACTSCTGPFTQIFSKFAHAYEAEKLVWAGTFPVAICRFTYRSQMEATHVQLPMMEVLPSRNSEQAAKVRQATCAAHEVELAKKTSHRSPKLWPGSVAILVKDFSQFMPCPLVLPSSGQPPESWLCTLWRAWYEDSPHEATC